MRARLVVLLAAVVFIAGCGSSSITPGQGTAGQPTLEPRTTTEPTQRSATTWPEVTTETTSPAPTSAPTATARPTAVATPGVTPAPTMPMPPITPPWAYDGTVDLSDEDDDSYSWYSWQLPSGVVLANGDVLLVRWDGLRAALRDGASGRWQSVPGLPDPRKGFGFVALEDGSALAIGGTNADGVSFSSVYRFDPVDMTWSRVGRLEWARTSPGVALLPDGRVLVAGGSLLNGEMWAAAPTAVLASHREHTSGRVELADVDPPTPVTSPYATAEIFDPATRGSAMVGSMACARGSPGVATLADGRIMFTEVLWPTNVTPPGCGAAEIYDPATGSFERTRDLPPLDLKALARRGVHAIGSWERLSQPVALGDGGALAVGEAYMEKHNDFTVGETTVRSLRFDPATNAWTQVGPTAAASDASGALEATRSWSMASAELVPLADGRLFIVGGSIPDGYCCWTPLSTTQIFDPSANTWTTLTAMPAPMDQKLGLRLADGSVLIIGRFIPQWGVSPPEDPYYVERPLTAIRYVFSAAH